MSLSRALLATVSRPHTNACLSCFNALNRQQSLQRLEIQDYFAQFINFCAGAVTATSAASLAPTSSTVFASSAPPSSSTSTASSVSRPTTSSPEATSIETLTTSVLKTSVVTTTQAGTTATFTAPGATVAIAYHVVNALPSIDNKSNLYDNGGDTIGLDMGSSTRIQMQSRQGWLQLQSPPADTYYCSPDECVPVYALPSTKITTIPFPFVQDYIYLNPSDFGLSVDRVFDVETTKTSTETFKSTTTASHTPTPSHSSHKVSAGIIAGSTVGGVAFVALLIALLSFFVLRRRRRRKQAALAAPAPPDEKAQLHSDDFKLIRTELDGGTKCKPVPPREMAANEDPKRAVSKLPANEVVGSEMESSAGKSLGTSSITAMSGS